MNKILGRNFSKKDIDSVNENKDGFALKGNGAIYSKIFKTKEEAEAKKKELNLKDAEIVDAKNCLDSDFDESLNESKDEKVIIQYAEDSNGGNDTVTILSRDSALNVLRNLDDYSEATSGKFNYAEVFPSLERFNTLSDLAQYLKDHYGITDDEIQENSEDELESDYYEDMKSEVYNALAEIYAKYNLKGAILKDLDSAVDFATIHMRDEFEESLKEGKECFFEIVFKEKGDEEEKTERYEDNFDGARADFLHMTQDDRDNYQYVVLRKVCTDYNSEEDIEVIDSFGLNESLKEDVEDIDVEAEVEEPKEDAKEPKLETFEEKIDFLVKDEDEAIAGYDKIIAMLGDGDVNTNAIEQLTHIKEEEVAHKDFLEVLKKDPSAIYNHEDKEEEPKEDEDDKIEVSNDEFIDDISLDDIDDAFGECIDEDTVKQNGKWVNKGKEGTHGKFDTKKKADAQRKAMFANGYQEDFDDDFGFNYVLDESDDEKLGTVDWNSLDDEDDILFKKIVKNTDDDILDKHFGKDTPERKLVGAVKDMKEDSHNTGHIKAKKPIELKARENK